MFNKTNYEASVVVGIPPSKFPGFSDLGWWFHGVAMYYFELIIKINPWIHHFTWVVQFVLLAWMKIFYGKRRGLKDTHSKFWAFVIWRMRSTSTIATQQSGSLAKRNSNIFTTDERHRCLEQQLAPQSLPQRLRSQKTRCWQWWSL